jgi:hypothetical protein
MIAGMRPWHSSVLAVSLAACAIEVAGLREGEADAGGRRDAGVEAGQPETDAGAPTGDAAGTLDAGPDASALIDAGLDAGSGLDAGVDAGASCEDIFRSVDGWIPCWETATSCAFNATTRGASCETVCAMFGRGCVEAYDNPNDEGDECVATTAEGCGHTGRGTELCECGR